MLSSFKCTAKWLSVCVYMCVCMRVYISVRAYKTHMNFLANLKYIYQFSSVQSFSHVWLFATPWTLACQASLSITHSRSLLKLMSIKSVMPSNHLMLCRPLLLPPSIFSQYQGLFKWVSSLHQVAKVSASASVLPMNIQDWFPLGWNGWISLLSKGLSRVFSIHDHWKNYSFD